MILCVSYFYSKSNKSKNIETTETTCHDIGIEPIDTEVLKSVFDELDTEQETTKETTKETTEEEFKFTPYTYWIDYDRKTGEVNVIDEQPLDSDLQKYIWDLCQEKSISFSLIMAQIGAECDFDSNKVSEVNATGLMQIRESCHNDLMNELGIKNISEDYNNVTIGVNLMSIYFNRFGEANLSLMAYNQGATNAKKLWNKGIYSTEYTDEILTVATKYTEIFGY